jgi:carboxymethylenebutenolidase
VNYGLVPKDAASVLRGACPIVASYGAKDVGGSAMPERLRCALTALQTPHDVKVYPGSGHRFMSEASGVGAVAARFARMSYREADAHDAWQRIYAFFGDHHAG